VPKAHRPQDALTSLSVEWLRILENEIRDTLHSEVSLLSEVPNYLLKLGGKRIRPALTFMLAQLCNQNTLTDDLLNIANGIELIHMATLLHDGIIDEAATRRGKESALSKFGLSYTLLAGNFLFVRAFGRCARLPSFIIKSTEKVCVLLTEGEIIEDEGIYRCEHALNIATRKTGALFGLAALAGIFVPTQDESLSQLGYSFGNDLGVAFQISDDILDVTSTEKELGKTPGTDIKERKPSLVNSLWYESKSQLARKILNSSDVITTLEISEALAEIENSGVIETTRNVGIEYVEKAKSTLNEICMQLNEDFDPNIRQKIELLTDYALDRLS